MKIIILKIKIITITITITITMIIIRVGIAQFFIPLQRFVSSDCVRHWDVVLLKTTVLV